ncbi:MAG: hypothetical protein COB84_05590 [Rhodobacteraceae bacterium]|nr:MAG: hypothetical protein COB84_05590 [Paracoccaceae bacterium]
MEKEYQKLVHAWVTLARRSEKDHEILGAIPKEEFEYWDELTDLVQSAPQKAWVLIKRITLLLSAEREYAYLSAGPFEDLLIKLGNDAEGFFQTEDQLILSKLLPYVWIRGLENSCREWVENERKFIG